MEVDFTQYYIIVPWDDEAKSLILREHDAEHARKAITKVLGYFVIRTRASLRSKVHRQCFRPRSRCCREGFRIFCHHQKREICSSQFEAHAGYVYESFNYAGQKSTIWSHIVFEHPSTFQTLAMEADKKKEIMEDVMRFTKARLLREDRKNVKARISSLWTPWDSQRPSFH